MSISIQQYPGQLDLANSNMLWEISSSFTGSAQYQYILAFQDGCGTTLTTIKQQPNPSGYGLFNMGRIVPQYLTFDTAQFNMGADSLFYKNQNTGKFFKVAFGEQYGTSVSSSVSVYNGIVNNVTGSPAQTGSNAYYYFINGTVDPNSGDWNWNTSSYYSPQSTPSSASFTKNVALTEAARTQSARPTDYLTIGVINGALNASTSSAQDIYALEIKIYSGSTVVNSTTEYNASSTTLTSFGGPRTTPVQLWPAVAGVQTCTNQTGSQTSGSFLLHIGIGPQNITNRGGYDLSTQPWDYYTATLRPQKSAGVVNTSASWDSFTINKQDPNCGYTGVRFAWVNDFGVWDWFNFQLQTNLNTNLERGTYQNSFVNYAVSTPTLPYDIKRRGDANYYININEVFTANSDWLTQGEADLLQQLFYSPSVFTQDGYDMVPIIILDSNFVTRTNPRTQKNFQYQVTYALANSKRSR
jgi:hypothetical protein